MDKEAVTKVLAKTYIYFTLLYFLYNEIKRLSYFFVYDIVFYTISWI